MNTKSIAISLMTKADTKIDEKTDTIEQQIFSLKQKNVSNGDWGFN